MKVTKFLVLAAFAAFAASASAQFARTSNSSSGLRGGGGSLLENDCSDYNRVSFGFMNENFREIEDGVSYTDDDMQLKGFTAGITHGFSLSKAYPVFVELGGRLNFATRAESESEDGVKWTDRLSHLALSVPVNLTYKLGFSNGFYVAPYAGIHFDLGLLFNEKESISGGGESLSNSMSLYSSDDMDDEPFKRFTMGYQVGGNIGYKNFNLGIGYKASFLPLYSEDDYKVQSNNFQVTLGYNF